MNDGLSSVLLDPEMWAFGSSGGFWARLVEHLGYTSLALLIAFVIAFPIGLLIGHTNRFAFLAINAGNAGRSLPTLGLIAIIVVLFGIGLFPITVALVVLAIPPILTNTYAAIRAVDPHTVDASRGMGMRERQVLLRVELPNGLPLIFSGLRNASLQVVSTATVAAYVGSGGLGRYLIDGLATRDYPEMFAGAVLVGLLAVTLDLVLAGAQRLVVSAGVSGRAATRRSRLPPSPSLEEQTVTTPAQREVTP